MKDRIITLLLMVLCVCMYCAVMITKHHNEQQQNPTIIYEQQQPGAPIVLKSIRVTAYCTCRKCCGNFSDGVTASGKNAVGKLIAAPKIIPFGTLLDVPGYGIASVEDRGGAITGNKLDLLFPTHQEALNWGVQVLDITIVK